jgi:hypothetical protein
MSGFWDNVSRYPRFFVSSVSGLILTILSPILNLGKSNTSKILIIGFLILIFLFIFITIRAMLDL